MFKGAEDHEQARKDFLEEQVEKIKNRLTGNDCQWSTKRNNVMVASYTQNFNRADVPVHRFERRTEIDRTNLINGLVPFKKMTKVGGFDKLILEEVLARNIVLTNDEIKNIASLSQS